MEQITQMLPSVVSLGLQGVASYTEMNSAETSSNVVWKSFETLTVKKQEYVFLVLGLTDGFQVYRVSEEGRAFDPIVSQTSDCPVAFVRILPVEPFTSMHLHLAVVSGTERGQFTRNCMKIFSVADKKYVHTVRFKGPIRGLANSRSLLAVALQEDIMVYRAVPSSHPADPLQLVQLTHTPCCLNPEDYAVMALGDRWLAYTSRDEPEGSPQSVTLSSPINHSPLSAPGTPAQHGSPPIMPCSGPSDSLAQMAQGLASGLYTLGGIGRKHIASMIQGEVAEESPLQGSVVVRDVVSQQTIAVLKAHGPLACLAFNPKGTLLVTVPVDGQYLGVYQVMWCPGRDKGAPQGSTVHLYSLFRGITHACIRHIAFSHDSRWLAAVSTKATVHVFGIGEGGPLTLSPAGLLFDSEPATMTLNSLARLKHAPQRKASVLSFCLPVTCSFVSSNTATDRLLVCARRENIALYELQATETGGSVCLELQPLVREGWKLINEEKHEGPGADIALCEESRWLAMVEPQTCRAAVSVWQTPQFRMCEYKSLPRPESFALPPSRDFVYEKFKSFDGLSSTDKLEKQLAEALGDLAIDSTPGSPAVTRSGGAFLAINEIINHFAQPSQDDETFEVLSTEEDPMPSTQVFIPSSLVSETPDVVCNLPSPLPASTLPNLSPTFSSISPRDASTVCHFDPVISSEPTTSSSLHTPVFDPPFSRMKSRREKAKILKR